MPIHNFLHSIPQTYRVHCIYKVYRFADLKRAYSFVKLFQYTYGYIYVLQRRNSLIISFWFFLSTEYMCKGIWLPYNFNGSAIPMVPHNGSNTRCNIITYEEGATNSGYISSADSYKQDN